MDTVIYRYTNSGRNLGQLKYDAATHEEDLDGTDKLSVTSTTDLDKRDKLVWQDASGDWHEHMVDHTERTRSGGGARTQSECSNSISELFGVMAPNSIPKMRSSVKGILSHLLNGTRWKVGACSDFGTVELEVWHKNVRQCIAELCELTGGELETQIEMVPGGGGIRARYVRIVKQRGGGTVNRAFTYGKNVSNIKREVGADEVYTAIRGYGAKQNEKDDSEYPAPITVDVYSKLDLSRWGVPMNSGYAHNWMTYTDSGCTDKAFLKRQCQRQLDVVSKPLVRYEFEVSEIEDIWLNVRIGSNVLCIDEGFNPAIHLSERVSHIVRNLKGKVSCRVAIGKRANPMVEQFKAQEKSAEKSSGNSSRTYSSSPVYTGGGSSYTGGYSGDGYSGGGYSGGGDGWVHQVNGVTQASGTVNFVTSSSGVTGVAANVAAGTAILWGAPAKENASWRDAVSTWGESGS